MPGREVIFEFHQVGAFIKVTAMDAASGEEVSITGATHATRDYLQKLAYDKLMLNLRKKGIVK